MKRLYLCTVIFIIASAVNLSAQKKPIFKVSDVDTLKAAINTIKDIRSLFGSKKEAVQKAFVINGIDYDDENLNKLETALSKVKSVKDVNVNYKDGTANIIVNSKTDLVQIWAGLTIEDRGLFKIAETNENYIVLKYKLQEKALPENKSAAPEFKNVVPQESENRTTQTKRQKWWRVNNTDASADFKSLLEANNSNNVMPGDTVFMEGSTMNYQSVQITKRLVILGSGYFLDENPTSSRTGLQAAIGSVIFGKGSDGSQLIGMYVGAGNSAGIGIRSNNILIKNCRIDASIHLTYGIGDIHIIGNFFFSKYPSTVSAIQFNSYGFPARVIFNNNITQKVLVLKEGYSILECKNNVFDCPAVANKPSILISTAAFHNNILKNKDAKAVINGGSNLHVAYNISSSAAIQFGSGNNNIEVLDMDRLFVSNAKSTSDGKYQIQTNSVASKSGSDGTDRGAFGGTPVSNRYKLSGRN